MRIGSCKGLKSPHKIYIHLECNHTWKSGLCRTEDLQMRPSWFRLGREPTDWVLPEEGTRSMGRPGWGVSGHCLPLWWAPQDETTPTWGSASRGAGTWRAHSRSWGSSTCVREHAQRLALLTPQVGVHSPGPPPRGTECLSLKGLFLPPDSSHRGPYALPHSTRGHRKCRVPAAGPATRGSGADFTPPSSASAETSSVGVLQSPSRLGFEGHMSSASPGGEGHRQQQPWRNWLPAPSPGPQPARLWHFPAALPQEAGQARL